MLEATNNEKWGPHGKALATLAAATLRGRGHYEEVMQVLQDRFNQAWRTPEKWRFAYKALLVLEHLIKNGSPDVVDDLRAARGLRELKKLETFSFMSPDMVDFGQNVRHRAGAIVALLEDPARIKEERAKAKRNAGKITAVASAVPAARQGGGSAGRASEWDDGDQLPGTPHQWDEPPERAGGVGGASLPVDQGVKPMGSLDDAAAASGRGLVERNASPGDAHSTFVGQKGNTLILTHSQRNWVDEVSDSSGGSASRSQSVRDAATSVSKQLSDYYDTKATSIGSKDTPASTAAASAAPGAGLAHGLDLLQLDDAPRAAGAAGAPADPFAALQAPPAPNPFGQAAPQAQASTSAAPLAFPAFGQDPFAAATPAATASPGWVADFDAFAANGPPAAPVPDPFGAFRIPDAQGHTFAPSAVHFTAKTKPEAERKADPFADLLL